MNTEILVKKSKKGDISAFMELLREKQEHFGGGLSIDYLDDNSIIAVCLPGANIKIDKVMFSPINTSILINGGIIGTEALIRWKHPKKGIVSPMSFIPLAEEIGYIQGISEWVIETAFAQKRQWEEKGLGNLKISINISNNCLKEKDFLKQFKKMLNKYNVDKKGIIIEITETSIMQNLKEGMIILSKLRESGIKIALDDFGTGYSSLNYLRKLPIDILKIDKDFIKDIEYEMKNEVILKYIIEVGHALGLKIVAEGIETIQQLSLLKTYGCDIGQGYLFSKPLEAEMLEEFSKRI
ncbi:EAL domain-containing protein [Clostridium cochlearium]|uniref:EAL domain-containing protein n=1 Tax=Clostridium cochlearium TaxID=1494 RepID=UPI001FABE379|nr:EAL domain-containing protein [Clostridium cochlearium]MCR1971768.1 EAL domain-containing protein [Clostridium cochlearium]